MSKERKKYSVRLEAKVVKVRNDLLSRMLASCQVWVDDITCVPMAGGFMYPAVAMDWYVEKSYPGASSTPWTRFSAIKPFNWRWSTPASLKSSTHQALRTTGATAEGRRKHLAKSIG